MLEWTGYVYRITDVLQTIFAKAINLFLLTTVMMPPMLKLYTNSRYLGCLKPSHFDEVENAKI